MKGVLINPQHPLEFFQTLFKSDTATAQAALYNDST